MSSSDITKDAVNLKELQEEIPAVFDLVRSLGYYPKEITPLLNEMSRVAFATFSLGDKQPETTVAVDEDSEMELTFYPILPRIRLRGDYQADKKASKPVCNKKSSKHPSLLPGIFTIFCQHGINSW